MHQIITSIGRRAIVAYSGGVDSTVVAFLATKFLGAEQVLAVTASSPTYPQIELARASQLAKALGLNWISIETNEARTPLFTANSPNRCYFCKHELFNNLFRIASTNRFDAVFDGTNWDDLLYDERPGHKAGLELGVVSPLAEARFSKDEIRNLARWLGLSNWDKPSMACLASRFPFGTKITLQALKQVEEGELVLNELGFKQYRIRWHNQIARLEILESQLDLAIKYRQEIVDKLKAIGFTFVTLDLEGFCSGSFVKQRKKTEGFSS